MTTSTLVATEPTTEMPLAPPDVPPDRGPARMGWFQRLGRETGYVVVTFPVAVAAFAVVVAGLSASAGLLITLIGFPVLVATGFAARGFAHFERAQIRDVLERDAASPRYRRSAPEDSLIRRIFVPLGDPQTWLDLLHGLVGFVTSIIAFVVVVTWWAVTLGGLSFPVWGWALPSDGQNSDLARELGFGTGFGSKVVVYLVLGVICAIALPFVVRAMAAVRWAPARALLSGRAEVQQQVESLEVGRAAARAAEATSLRRLERDIHDGPQQRLVRLSMDLGRARKQAAEASPALLDTLDGALAQTRDTLDELRALSRGIAPPVLADRGLRAALEELAARSTVPVDISFDLPDERLAAHVETTAYFVVSEALTNVAKHSGARHALVAVELVDGRLRVRVTDDGRGGAHLSKGQGLLGLGDRVRAADGALVVTSPDGGPTVVDAEIPCGS
jgi:signal transduction histidine kinase